MSVFSALIRPSMLSQVRRCPFRKPSETGLFLDIAVSLSDQKDCMACRGSGVRVSLAPFNRSPASGWVFLLPMRGDDSARCPVLVQKDEALQALCAHLAKGAGLGT